MYCTVDDVLRLLPEDEVLRLADDPEARTLDHPSVRAVMSEVIDQADREIDMFVGAVRSVPLSPVPGLISNISAKLAGHYLWMRRPFVEEPEAWQRETAYVRRVLQMIADGRLSLGSEGSEATSPEDGGTISSAPERIFTEAKWSDW